MNYIYLIKYDKICHFQNKLSLNKKLMTLCSVIIMYPEINKKNTVGTNIFCGDGGAADEVSKAYGFSDIQPICCVFLGKGNIFYSLAILRFSTQRSPRLNIRTETAGERSSVFI